VKTVLTVALLLLLTRTAYAADLYKPDGPGPFPAVVLLHSCGGIRPYNHDWAQQLKEHGFVAKVVDSFGPRGLDIICADNALMGQMLRQGTD
jgi:dienelactone hydrolase